MQANYLSPLKLFTVLLITITILSPIYGQNVPKPISPYGKVMIPDPVRDQLERVKRGEQKLMTLLPLVDNLYRREPAIAYELIDQISQLEEYQQFTEHWAKLLYYKTWIDQERYVDQEELELLVESAKEVIATFETSRDQLWLARAHVLAAQLCFQVSFNNEDSLFKAALLHKEQALSLIKSQKSIAGEAYTLLGEIYRVEGNICLQQPQCPYDSAWYYYEQALEFFLLHEDQSEQALAILNQAILLGKMEKANDTLGIYQDPIPYYHSAIAQSNQVRDLQATRFEYALFLQNRFNRTRALEWSSRANEQLRSIIQAPRTSKAASFFQLAINAQNVLAYRGNDLSEERSANLLDSVAYFYEQSILKTREENNLKIYNDAFNRIVTICPYLEKAKCSKILAAADEVKTFFIKKNKTINQEINRRSEVFRTALETQRNYNLKQNYFIFFLLLLALGVGLLVWQRIRRLKEKVALEKKATAIKQEALRAQMNPHFISNTINAIESLVNQGCNDEASEYLIDFSRLCRLVIEHSRHTSISLADEIDTLRYFLSLEELRLGEDLEYIINVNPNLDTQAIQIPPLIIQPFVENAIWHGIKNKPEPKRGVLKIEVNPIGEKGIELVVEDNGVGRAKASAIQAKSVIKQKSWGTTLTQERIKHLKKGLDAQLIIEDLTDESGQASGTKVSIQLPLNLTKQL